MTSRTGFFMLQPRIVFVALAASVLLSCASTHRAVRPAAEDPFVHAIAGAMEEQDRRLGAALREYGDAVSVDDDPYLWHKVGTLSLRVGDVEHAAFALARAVESPDAPLAWLRQAAAVQSLSGRSVDALKIHLRVLGARPGDHGSSLAAAKILSGLDMPDSAVAVLASMDPPWPQEQALAVERARLLLDLGHPELAATLCDSAPEGLGTEGRLLCAAALAATGQVEKAVAAYGGAATGCQDRVAEESYGALLRLGRPDEAAEVAARASSCPGRAGAWATRHAWALLAAGRLQEAARLLEMRVRDERQDAAALDLLALASFRLGLTGRAESLLERGVAEFPDVPALRRRLAGLYQDLGRTNDALRVLEVGADTADTSMAAALMANLIGAGYPERAVEVTATNPFASIETAFQTAAAWERLACVRRSASLFEELLERDPGNAQACNYLGYMLAERGLHLARAESLVLCALRIEPHNPYYLDSIGWVYYQQGRLSDAVSALRGALEIDPEEPEVMKHLGIVLRATGSWEEGMALLRQAVDARPWDVELRELVKEGPP